MIERERAAVRVQSAYASVFMMPGTFCSLPLISQGIIPSDIITQRKLWTSRGWL